MVLTNTHIFTQTGKKDFEYDENGFWCDAADIHINSIIIPKVYNDNDVRFNPVLKALRPSAY